MRKECSITNEIIDFYENKYSEDERLKRHRLELIRTQEIISRYLTHGIDIIDIGGATGVYSLWLASQGYNVTLFDIVPKHIETARAKALEMNQAGFSEIKLISVEGFASCFSDDIVFKDNRRLELALKYLRETESIPELSLSYHTIAVGIKAT